MCLNAHFGPFSCAVVLIVLGSAHPDGELADGTGQWGAPLLGDGEWERT